MTRQSSNIVSLLSYTIKQIKYHGLYKALGISAWNIHKKHKAKNVLLDTLVWLWGKILSAKDQMNAEATYYYAQVYKDTRHLKKHFLNHKWQVKCQLSNKTGPSGTLNLTSIAQIMISETGLTKKTKNQAGYDDAKQKIAQYLRELNDEFEGTMQDMDLSDVKDRFMEQAVAALRLKRLE